MSKPFLISHDRISIIEDIWATIISELPESAKGDKDELMALLRASDRQTALLLLGSSWTHPEKMNDVTGLAEDIIATKKHGLKSVRNQIVLLAGLIERGNECGLWSLPLPPVSVFIKREKTPFIPAKMATLKIGRQQATYLLNSIRNPQILSDKAKAGQVLMSAIIRGGLLNIASINALHQQLSTHLQTVNGRCFFDLSLRWRGNDDMEKRRWFPDPLTELLLLRMHLTPDTELGTPWKCIRAFLIELGVSPGARPKSLSALINSIALDLQLKMPPFLVNYATRSFISHSLKNHTWLRCHNLIAENKISPDDEDVEFSGKSDVDQETENEDTFYCQPTWTKEIRAALNQPTKKAASISLSHCHKQATTDEWPPFALLLVEWVQYLLSHGSKTNRPLALSTARTYFSTVWMRIYGLVGEQDMTSMNEEAFEEIYSQILEDSPSLGMRRKLARTLGEFHAFMVKVHLSPTIYGSLLGIGNTLTPVDANIITIEEFHETLRLLEDSDLILLHQDFPMIARLITIIAFRCGLRRSEVLKLRTIDVQGVVKPEILVRPHATRRLKTRSSTRRILLSCLLESDELKLLLDWVKIRQEQAHSYSPYLFSIPSKGYVYVPEEVIFPAIHTAMRQAANDESLRFHHFRHSCASWAILRLMIADYGMPRGFFEHLPETSAWLKKSSDFKRALYGSNQPTRKHLYAVASVLGHSSPDIALEHYIHCCDIILHHVLAKSLNPLDKKDMALASSLPQSTAFRLLGKDGTDALLKAVRKKEPSRWTLTGNPATRLSNGTAQSPSDKITPPSAYSMLDRAWKLLYLHSAQDMPLEDLAERYRFTDGEADVLVKEATRISLLCNKGRYHNYRHRMITTGNGERLICPIRPRGDAAINLATDFAERLCKLSASHRSDYQWLLSYYIENAWTRSSDLIFRNTDEVDSFLKIIDVLNISKPSLKFTWYHGRKRMDMTDDARRRHWRAAICLPRKIKIHDKKLNDTRPLGKYGWLGIRLLDYLGKEKDKTSHAYRYILIMNAICAQILAQSAIQLPDVVGLTD